MVSTTTKYRFGKTVFLYFVFAIFGLTMSLAGPSVPDLCEAMDVTAEQISVAFSVSSIMWTVGAIFFGPVIDRFQNFVDVFLGVSLVIMAICTFIKPYSPVLWVYVTATAIEALAYAGIDLSSNVMIFSTWGEQSNSPIQGLHAAWGLGFAVGPLVIRPFLGPDRDDGDDGAYNGTTAMMTTSLFTAAPERESRIEVAYILAGCLALVLALIAFVIQATGVPKGVVLHLKAKESFKSVFAVRKIAGGDLCFGIVLLVLFALFYFGNAGRENVFNYWLFNYAVESDFTKQEAALLDAAAKFSFLGGRVIAALIALKVPIQLMTIAEVFIVLVFVVCLGLLGTKEKVYLWVFACLTNFFSSPIWSGGLAWTDRYIIVSGLAFTVMNIGAGFSGLFFNYFTGWLFTNRDADAVMYVLFFCAAIMCVLIVIMQVVASRHGDRYTKVEAVVDVDDTKQQTDYGAVDSRDSEKGKLGGNVTEQGSGCNNDSSNDDNSVYNTKL